MLGLQVDGSFHWTTTSRWGATKQRSRDGWQVGSSTFLKGDRDHWPAWVFPDGSAALSAVPVDPKAPQYGNSPNFSPESLNVMVNRLGLDAPLEGEPVT